MSVRKTVTLDPDVRAEIDRLCKERGVRMKVIINEAMRSAFADMEAELKQRPPTKKD